MEGLERVAREDFKSHFFEAPSWKLCIGNDCSKT